MKEHIERLHGLEEVIHGGSIFESEAAVIAAGKSIRAAISALEKQERYEALLKAAIWVRVADPDDDSAHDALYAAIDALEDE